jgi:hypothetical protein
LSIVAEFGTMIEEILIKGANTLGKAASNRDDQVLYLKQRLGMFLEVLDSIDPEHTDLDDIDRLIQMIDDLEMKVDQFKK